MLAHIESKKSRYTLHYKGDTGNSMHINDLPNEILIIIFSLLNCESVQAVEKVCLRWQFIALSSAVWEHMRLVLCMKNYQVITDNIIPRVAGNLKYVKLQYFKLYQQIRVPLTIHCRNLVHLEVSISQVSSSIFEDLKCWPLLRFLSFRNSLIMIDNNDSANRNYVFHLPFENLTKLETLVLSNFALTPTSLDNMLQCMNLVKINIEKMKNIPSDFLKQLISSKMYSLKELCIYGDTLNDEILMVLAKCKRLTTLHIMTCKNLFDSSLIHLSNLTNLQSIKLRHGYFSTSALYQFFSKENFHHLKFLSLSRCSHVTMEIAKLIKKNAPNLTELSFYLCPFVMAANFDRSELLNLFDIQLLLD